LEACVGSKSAKKGKRFFSLVKVIPTAAGHHLETIKEIRFTEHKYLKTACRGGSEATAQRIQKLYKPLKRHLFTLPDFCQSPSAICDHSTVSRLGVIRYVANKLGDAHWENREVS